MLITKSNKCFVCKSVVLSADFFDAQINIFGNEIIDAELASRIKAWRDKPVACIEHKGLEYTYNKQTKGNQCHTKQSP